MRPAFAEVLEVALAQAREAEREQARQTVQEQMATQPARAWDMLRKAIKRRKQRHHIRATIQAAQEKAAKDKQEAAAAAETDRWKRLAAKTPRARSSSIDEGGEPNSDAMARRPSRLLSKDLEPGSPGGPGGSGLPPALRRRRSSADMDEDGNPRTRPAEETRQKEVRRLHDLYQAELRGEKPPPGVKSLRQLVLLRGGDTSQFSSVLKCMFPLMSASEMKTMLEWVAPKAERINEETQQMTDAHRIEARVLFGLDVDLDGSGSIELAELQEAGWGAKGTEEGRKLKEAFERLDVDRVGSLKLQQFEMLAVECYITTPGGGLSAKVTDKQRRSALRAFAAKKVAAGESARRPSLSDLTTRRTSFREAVVSATDGIPRRPSPPPLKPSPPTPTEEERSSAAPPHRREQEPEPETSGLGILLAGDRHLSPESFRKRPNKG